MGRLAGRTNLVVVKDPSAGGFSNSLGLVVNWFDEPKRRVPTK